MKGVESIILSDTDEALEFAISCARRGFNYAVIEHEGKVLVYVWVKSWW